MFSKPRLKNTRFLITFSGRGTFCWITLFLLYSRAFGWAWGPRTRAWARSRGPGPGQTGCNHFCSKLIPLSKLSVRRLQNCCTFVIFHQKHQNTYYFLHIFDQPRSQARAHGPGPRPSLGPGAHQVPGPGPCSRAQGYHSLRPGPIATRAQNIYTNSLTTAIGRLYS